MNWIAIPFALLTVVSTFAGGAVALRLRHELPTLMALTGGVVVAVALFDVLPEASTRSATRSASTALVGARLPRLLPRRAGARPPPPRRRRAGPRPRPGRRARRARALAAQLHRRARDRARVRRSTPRPALLVFIAVVSPRLRRRAEHGQLRPQPVRRPPAGDRAGWRSTRWPRSSGAIVGASVAVSEHALGQLLALYAGFFLFMGATDLLPEAHQHPSRLRVALTAVGFVAIFAVSALARNA